jgi:CRISPR-associated endonuclease/helicase Cas3
MITAVAPIDSLIQRMGRVQRHRPAAGSQGVRVALTGVWQRADGRIAFPQGTVPQVYDEAALLRSWALLRDRAAINCPGDVQGLIDRVYDDRPALECPPEWPTQQWDRAHTTWFTTEARDVYRGLGMRLPRVDGPLDLPQLTFRPTSASRTRSSRPYSSR